MEVRHRRCLRSRSVDLESREDDLEIHHSNTKFTIAHIDGVGYTPYGIVLIKCNN